MNWAALIVLSLRIRLRRRFWLDLLLWWIKPIRDLGQQHEAAKASIFLRARQTSQQGPLSKMLTDLLGVEVVVSTRENANTAITIYKEVEGRESPHIFLEEEGDEDPLFVDLEQENVERIDFDVNVDDLASPEFTDLIKTVVNRVKLAGKKYIINYQDLSVMP